MGGVRRKKGQAGEAARFISRNRAIKKLQLSIGGFNRLCIIKGIYPIEPNNRIRAQGGHSKYRALYLKKDIRFLLHDPMIWTIREEYASMKKLRVALHKKDDEKATTIKRNKPVYSLSQNVLERYPTFVDAVKDLGDPLTMIFLFCNIQVSKPVMEHHISRCQRLRWEFLTYVIETQCLTKVFITTKGYYYEAEIMGKKIVWTVPHSCVTEVPAKASMKIMKHFLEFYIAMVGHVNFHLLQKAGFRYPLKPANTPYMSTQEKKDLDNYKNLMASLNYKMERMSDADEDDDMEESAELNSDMLKLTSSTSKKAYLEQVQSIERRKLFKGLKFFIGRENNRESLTLVIRNCGGEVSWPSTVFPCSTYQEDDETITHQICDRPNFQKQYLSRYYIQPQWVYDCLNAATLHPVQPYFPGEALPPHICPFLRDIEGWYVPPEEEMLRKLLESTPLEKERIFKELAAEEKQKLAEERARAEEFESSDEESEAEDDEDEDNEEEQKEENKNNEGDSGLEEMEAENETPKAEEKPEKKKKKKKSKKLLPTQPDEKDKDGPRPQKEIRRGREMYVSEKTTEDVEAKNEYKMRAFMIHPKNKRLYNKMRNKEIIRERRNTALKDRREAIEATKSGKMTQEELDHWRPAKAKTTVHERKKKTLARRIKKAVDFAKSDRNPNKDRKTKK